MSVANRCLSPTDSSEEPIYLTIRYNITRSDVGTIPRAVIELKQHKSCIKKIQSVPFQYRCLQRRSTSIAGVEDRIQDGDIIAATSTVAGLDIAHTGIALWRDGRLHLLHAPLAGGVVQISELSLAERIQRIGGQDGVMVARPLEAR